MQNISLLLTLLFVIPSTILSQPNTPKLWQRAVSIQARNLDIVPGKMTMKFELLDKNGQSELVDISTYKIKPGADGKPESELILSTHNGKDMTETRKKQEEKEKEKRKKEGDETSAGYNLKESPLHPDNQEIITVKDEGAEGDIKGKTCREFSYTLPLGESTKNGKIWIDVETGAPIKQEFTTSPLPPKMKKMKNFVTYHYQPDSTFYISEMRFEGVAGLLILKKSFRGTITFEDFWRNDSQ